MQAKIGIYTRLKNELINKKNICDYKINFNKYMTEH